MTRVTFAKNGDAHGKRPELRHRFNWGPEQRNAHASEDHLQSRGRFRDVVHNSSVGNGSLLVVPDLRAPTSVKLHRERVFGGHPPQHIRPFEDSLLIRFAAFAYFLTLGPWMRLRGQAVAPGRDGVSRLRCRCHESLGGRRFQQWQVQHECSDGACLLSGEACHVAVHSVANKQPTPSHPRSTRSRWQAPRRHL